MTEFLVAQAFEFIALVCLLVCSAFFSGAETALFSLKRAELHRIKINPIRGGRPILNLLSDPRALLGTILFGNMVVNIIFYAITTRVSLRLVTHASPGVAVVFAALAPLIVIVFGEVSPKGIAVGHALGFSRIIAPPLYVFHRIIRPVSLTLKWMTRLLSDHFVSRLPRTPRVTRGELKMLTGMAEHQGAFDRHTRSMLEQVVAIADICVNEVMIPRVDTVMFDLALSREDFCTLVRATRMERIPVFERSKDHVVGVIRSRDVLLQPKTDLKELVQPIRFVPETQTVENLLGEFRRSSDPIAIVVDEYGGTAGMVTMTTLLEEIVGEIRRESEAPETPIVLVDEDTYLLAGDLNMHEWSQLLGVGYDPAGVETVAGFVLSLMGHIPRTGEAVEWAGLRFTIESMDGRRVTQVRVQRLVDKDED